MAPRTQTRAFPNARETALRILHDIETQHAYTDVALRRALHASPLATRERAFVTECVYGVMRWRGRLDWLLAHACQYPLERLTPWIRNVLRLGLYQCLWMDGVPPRAAVHESVRLARRFGHAGTARLVNGVLRTLLRQQAHDTLPDPTARPAAHLAVAFSHPEWLVARWLQRYGWDRTAALCEANSRPADVTLRCNTLRTCPDDLAQRLRHEGLRQVTPSPHVPEALIVQGTARLDALPSYRAGRFQVQDVAAMLVAPLCRAQAGQRLLDVCAAPGGKTTHLAQLMHDRGLILACDLQPGRLRLLRDNVRRLGLTCVAALAADARQPVPIRGTFDCILLDAPCTGLGVLRRRPDVKWTRTPEDLHRMQALQLCLLEAQHRLLAPEGRLVYSVCSNEPEETHEVVARFLATHPQMQLEAISADELPAAPVCSSATPGTLDLTPEQWQTDGVFVARFRRARGAGASRGKRRPREE